MGLLVRERAALVVVDVQEGFRPYDAFARRGGARARSSLQAARILELPTLVSEQYPKGLGHTAPEVGLEDEPRIEKTVFSAARAEGFDLRGARRRRSCAASRPTCASARPSTTCSPTGIEVHVPADAVGSRHELDYERGLERMERAGAVVSTVEAALFELLERAGTPEFKAVQKLII